MKVRVTFPWVNFAQRPADRFDRTMALQPITMNGRWWRRRVSII